MDEEMDDVEVRRRKRLRSEGSEHICPLQSKIRVNQKIVDANSSEKMEQIYHKTMDILFKAARKAENASADGAEDPKSRPLWRQIILSGDGTISFYDDDLEPTNFALVRRRAECCDRMPYIRSECSCCPLKLCEECGYSCADCGQFVCNKCVSIFGCGTAERPLCEKCLLFN